MNMSAIFRVVTRIQDQDDFSGNLNNGEFLRYNSSTGKFQLQSVSPGGDSGQLQYNSSSSFAGVNHSSIGISGDIFKLSSLAVDDIPLVIKGYSGQTSNLTEWRNNSDSVVAKIDPSGSFDTGYKIKFGRSGVLTSSSDLRSAEFGHNIYYNETENDWYCIHPSATYTLLELLEPGSAGLSIWTGSTPSNVNSPITDWNRSARFDVDCFGIGEYGPWLYGSATNRIQLGGTTSASPMLFVNGAGIDFKLADNSAGCDITAANITVSGNITNGSQAWRYTSGGGGIEISRNAQTGLSALSVCLTTGAYARSQGSISIAIGGDVSASALRSIAIGDSTFAGASNAVAIGYNVTNNVANSVSIGTSALTCGAITTSGAIVTTSSGLSCEVDPVNWRFRLSTSGTSRMDLDQYSLRFVDSAAILWSNTGNNVNSTKLLGLCKNDTTNYLQINNGTEGTLNGLECGVITASGLVISESGGTTSLESSTNTIAIKASGSNKSIQLWATGGISTYINGAAKVQFSTDSLRPWYATAYDLGDGSDANYRWRDLWLTRNATIGGTITVSGTATISGLLTLPAGFRSNDRSLFDGVLAIGGSLTASLIHPNNMRVTWTDTSSYTGSIDTAIGRDSAGVVGLYTSVSGSTKAALTCGAITAGGNIYPTVTNVGDIGISGARWGHVYLQYDANVNRDFVCAASTGRFRWADMNLQRNNSTTLGIYSDYAATVPANVVCGVITASGNISATGNITAASYFIGQHYYSTGYDNFWTKGGSGASSTFDICTQTTARIRNYANNADAGLSCGAITASGHIYAGQRIYLGGTDLELRYTGSAVAVIHAPSGQSNVYGLLCGSVSCTTLTASGTITGSANSAASTPASTLTGTWFTGGTSTTTKPHFLIEPTGTTSTAWNTSGTGIGINATTGFAGNLVDIKVANSTTFSIGNSSSAGRGLYTNLRADFWNYRFSVQQFGAVIESGGYFGSAGSADSSASADVTLSRSSAGVWQIGTTAANASGSLLLTNLTASGYVSAGASANMVTPSDHNFASRTVASNANSGSIVDVCSNTGHTGRLQSWTRAGTVVAAIENTGAITASGASGSGPSASTEYIIKNSSNTGIGSASGGHGLGALMLISGGTIVASLVNNSTRGFIVRSDMPIGFCTNTSPSGFDPDAYFVRNSASSIGVKGASGIDGALTCGAITASSTVTGTYYTASNSGAGFGYKLTGNCALHASAGITTLRSYSGNDILLVDDDRLRVSAPIQETPTQSSVDPTTTDIPLGKKMSWYNSTLNEFRDWVNIGGTLLKSAAYT